ncbi:hypothetical protein AMJ85_11275 [candidate division BRC1 bacterium SM23_51]|nr:MAG: hypothetical protein AMJ85_11275 [candidate division BRC1 bacterium SM23_51]
MTDDDHNYSQGQFPLKVQFPLTPDTSYLETVFKPAYIKPDFSEVSGYTNTIPFGAAEWNMTLDRFRALAAIYCTVRARAGPWYWCGYLMGGFQSPEAEDGDPDSEDFTMGFADRNERRGGAVFLETYRDLAAWMTANGKTLKPFSWIAVHEMGHVFTLCHWLGQYNEAPQDVGYILQRNGNQLILDRQLDEEGFRYIGSMLTTYDNNEQRVLRSESRILSYSNDPQNNRCTVTVSTVSGSPSAGHYFVIFENSIMCRKASYWNEGVFAPRDLDVLRETTASPVHD